jgi:hypothetical protein
MKKYLLYSLILLTVLFTSNTYSQFNDQWRCAYATIDDQPNATGIQTISVAVVEENAFAAMVSQAALPWEAGDACYLVGYRNADSTNGRLGYYAYNTPFNQIWLNGFDQVFMEHARDIAAYGNLILVANNDADHNILVFELGQDSVYTYPKRMITKLDPFVDENLWGIDVDASGRVYVTVEGNESTPSKIYIFGSIDTEPAWNEGFNAQPLQVITLPENGDARDVTVTPGGDAIWVTNYLTKKVYCYVGNPSSGYQLQNGFNFTLTDAPVSSAGATLDPGPWGIKFMPLNNWLFVACDVNFSTGTGYEYGRVYILNPNTGEIADTIDAAGWNFAKTGGYNMRPSGTFGTASGYTSLYNVDFDEKNNVYTQSFYGWTVDKWVYEGTLPSVNLTITSVEKTDQIPTVFTLNQNYPNPFNPTTYIEFSLPEQSFVNLKIYSVTGEVVANVIENKEFSSGVYKYSFDASKLASGTYIYSLSNGKSIINKKMLLIK